MKKDLAKTIGYSLAGGALYTIGIQIPVLGIFLLLPFMWFIPHVFASSSKYLNYSFVSLQLTSIEAYIFYGALGTAITFVLIVLKNLVRKLWKKLY